LALLRHVENTKLAKRFLRADDRDRDVSHRQPSLRRLLSDQLVGLDLVDPLETNEDLDGLVDVAACFQGLLQLLHLAFQPSRIPPQRSGKDER
jgi:hypothetical protein